MASPRVPLIVVDDRKGDASSSNRHPTPNSSTLSSPFSSNTSSCAQRQDTDINSSQTNDTVVSMQAPSSPSSSPSSSFSSCNTTKNKVDNQRTDATNTTNNCNIPMPKINIHPSKPQISMRSSSDITIPAASMPNLALHQSSIAGGGRKGGCDGGGEIGVGGVAGGSGGGVEGCGESYLGVYCSPRTTRRSVDLDMKETVPGQYDWMDSQDTSANSLKVLTASSRVGSALSLNSECTTRSIGLLSNDSDSEEFSQSDAKPSGQGQLRRFMSYPEEGQIPESHARPSQSLSNLKSANQSPSLSRGDRFLQRQSLDYADLGDSTNTIIVLEESSSNGRRLRKGSSELSKGNEVDEDNNGGGNDKCCSNNKNVVDDTGKNLNVETVVNHIERVCEDGRLIDSASGCGGGDCSVGGGSNGSGIRNRRNQQDSNNIKTGRESGGHNVVIAKHSVIGSVRKANNNNMLCYKCDSNSPSREGRIRQWLQDMDTTHGDDVIQ